MSNFLKSSGTGEEGWISVSDIMAGLMMVFLFIAVLYAIAADERNQMIGTIVGAWQNSEQAITHALQQEFAQDLPRWNAELDANALTIRFLSPEILFGSGDARLRPQFQRILDDFCPRYLHLLARNYADQIDEIRIEGHTSSRWGTQTGTAAFIENMRLSQARTRSVLEYCLRLPSIAPLSAWVIRTVSANGLSSARVLTQNGVEDPERSRRVEFRVTTKSKAALFDVIQTIRPNIHNDTQVGTQNGTQPHTQAGTQRLR